MRLFIACAILCGSVAANAAPGLMECGVTDGDFNTNMVVTNGNPLKSAANKMLVSHGEHLIVYQDGKLERTDDMRANPANSMHVQVTNWDGIGIQISVMNRGYAFSKSPVTYYDFQLRRGLACRSAE